MKVHKFKVTKILSKPMKFEFNDLTIYGVSAEVEVIKQYSCEIQKEILKFDTMKEAKALKVGDRYDRRSWYEG